MPAKTLTILIASFTVLGAAAFSQTRPAPRPAYCTFNEANLTWKIGNEAIERTIVFDKSAGTLRTHSLKTGTGEMTILPVGSSEGEISLQDGAGKAVKLTLDHDWTYGWQTVATPANGGRSLTVHLSGVRSNTGYEVEANYEVIPGKKPYFIRSLTLINRTDKAVTVESCLYDRWAISSNSVPGKKIQGRFQAPPHMARFVAGPTGSGTLVDDALGAGATVSVEASGEVMVENSAVVSRWKGSLEATAQNGRAYIPETVVFAFRGVAPSGADLLTRYRAGKIKK